MRKFLPTTLIHNGDCEIVTPYGSFYVPHIREVGIYCVEQASVEALLPHMTAVPIGGTVQLSLLHNHFPRKGITGQDFLMTEWFLWMDVYVKAEGASSWQHSTRLHGVRREGCDIIQEAVDEQRGAWILTGNLSYTFERYGDPLTDGLNVLTNSSKRWYF